MVEGLSRTIKKLEKRELDTKKETPTTFKIEYTAPYALRVHEDLATPRTSGQAKFLETALRQNEDKIRQIIVNLVRKKKGLRHAIKRAAEFALQESNKLVPVRTGQLKRSGRVVLVD